MDETVYMPLFEKIDDMLKKGRVNVAIDGGSASGKTTLGNILAAKYGCSIFHMDDFFLQPHQRTTERYSEVGGNVDRERFLAEVLTPLKENREIQYRRFDCSLLQILPSKTIVPSRLNVTEGAYSAHPELMGYYDLTVFLDIEKNTQRERIKKRNGENAQMFFEKWIPLEETYFEKTDIKNRCDLIIKIK